MTHIEKMKQWLEAMEKSLPRLAPYGEQDWLDSKAAIASLRQAIAEAEREPRTDLIDRLRDTASKGVSVWGDLMLEAAKEIEILTAERECYASSMDRILAAQPKQCTYPNCAYPCMDLPDCIEQEPVATVTSETSAERTLKSLGYTDNGGEYWKPPLGAWPPQPKQEPVAMREALKKLARFLDVVRVYAQEIRPIHELETDKPLHWKAREIQDEVIRLINTIPQQEPIHWIAPNFEFLFSSKPQRTEQETVIDKSAAIRIATALGWEPKREWVGLTDDEIEAIWYAFHDREMGYVMRFTRAIEAKLKQKNGYAEENT